jgi:hypothetical protein
MVKNVQFRMMILFLFHRVKFQLTITEIPISNDDYAKKPDFGLNTYLGKKKSESIH